MAPVHAIARYSLEDFQSKIARARGMEAEGLIEIESAHSESNTGNRYIDMLKFRRLE